MPIVKIHLLEGREQEKKKQLVREVTQAICRSLDVKPQQVRIILDEMSRDSYSVGGELFSEREK